MVRTGFWEDGRFLNKFGRIASPNLTGWNVTVDYRPSPDNRVIPNIHSINDDGIHTDKDLLADINLSCIIPPVLGIEE